MAYQLQHSQFLSVPAGGLPSGQTFTVCGWAQKDQETSDGQVIFILFNSGTLDYVIWEWDNVSFDQIGLADDGNTSGGGTPLLLTAGVGTPFFWAVTSSGFASGNTNAWWRFPGQSLLSTGSLTGNPRGALVPDTMYFGQQPSGTTEKLYGRLWNLMAWSRVLTPAEILAQSYRRAPLNKTAMTFWCPLEKDLFDYSGGKNHLTASAAVPNVSSPIILPRPLRALKGFASLSASGSATIVEPHDTISASGALSTSGSAAINEVADVVAASGALSTNGTAAILEGADVVAGAGIAGVSGTGAVSEGADVVSGAGSLSTAGSAAITEGVDTVTGAGTAGNATIGSGSVNETSDVVAGTGVLSTSGSGAVVEAPDAVAATGSTPILGSASIAEAHDVVVGSGVTPDIKLPSCLLEVYDVQIGVALLRWNASPGAIGYRIYINGAAQGTVVSGQSATVSGLLIDTPYTFGVVAVNAAGVDASILSNTIGYQHSSNEIGEVFNYPWGDSPEQGYVIKG